jgi:predicted anti-sigma-YlaC factor YlaD
MNCQLCKNLSEAYAEGSLTSDTKSKVEAHIADCEECREVFRLQSLAGSIIKHEKETVSNPFLATRVMALIEDSEIRSYSQVPLFKRVIRPVLITTALAAALFYGIIIGNIYKGAGTGSTIPIELALINDANLESVNLLSNE